MTDIVLLEALQKFLQENVASQIKLKKPNEENALDYNLVNPAVHIGWIPPNGMPPKELGIDMPYVVVGHDNGEDNGNEAGLNIRLTFAIWNPGCKDNNGNMTPNFEGYRDLLNFMEKAKHELRSKRIIEQKTTVEFPIKWGMYQEPPYPYWYGWITFMVRTEPGNYIPGIYENYLI